LTRAFAYLALASFAVLPRAIDAQGIPDALKDKALVVRVIAIVPRLVSDPAAPALSGMGKDTGGDPGWRAESEKSTVTGTPVPFKLVGSNMVIIVQITPFELQGGKGVTLVAQGQVWVQPPEGGFSYHTTIDTLSVDFGESVFFFPLGLDPAGKAPMRLEISVVRASKANSEGGGAVDKAGK
jgi:hypothetical protein